MRLLYRVARLMTFWLAEGFCGARVLGVPHVPRAGPVLLASNHQSFLDPMLVTFALPRECHYMARDTLFTNPCFARIIRTFNAFPIKRSTADLAGVKETLRRLKAGALVTTFPESTRSADGRIAPFQPGVFTIARKASAPVVPAVIEGAYDAWPRKCKLPRPARVWVEYGPAMSPELIADLGPKSAAVELTRQVRMMHNALRRRMGRPPFDYAETE